MAKLLSRRDFLSTLTLGGGLSMYQTLKASVKPESLCCRTPEIEPESTSLADNSLLIHLPAAHSILEPGSAASFSDEERSLHIIIVHDVDNSYHACAKFCTHGGHQSVSYIPKRQLLQCNGYSHSLFTLQGEVKKGPAPEPLKRYTVRKHEQTLEISLV
jgi:nitrite reductase/ring-hydroxylating ferredoxin subunit